MEISDNSSFHSRIGLEARYRYPHVHSYKNTYQYIWSGYIIMCSVWKGPTIRSPLPKPATAPKNHFILRCTFLFTKGRHDTLEMFLSGVGLGSKRYHEQPCMVL